MSKTMADIAFAVVLSLSLLAYWQWLDFQERKAKQIKRNTILSVIPFGSELVVSLPQDIRTHNHFAVARRTRHPSSGASREAAERMD